MADNCKQVLVCAVCCGARQLSWRPGQIPDRAVHRQEVSQQLHADLLGATHAALNASTALAARQSSHLPASHCAVPTPCLTHMFASVHGVLQVMLRVSALFWGGQIPDRAVHCWEVDEQLHAQLLRAACAALAVLSPFIKLLYCTSTLPDTRVCIFACLSHHFTSPCK